MTIGGTLKEQQGRSTVTPEIMGYFPGPFFLKIISKYGSKQYSIILAVTIMDHFAS